MNVDELIDNARIIVLQPGDLIIVEFPHNVPVSAAQAADIKARIKEHPALANHDALVLGGGARLGAVRPAS